MKQLQVTLFFIIFYSRYLMAALSENVMDNFPSVLTVKYHIPSTHFVKLREIVVHVFGCVYLICSMKH